jgi:hypothetical protein
MQHIASDKIEGNQKKGGDRQRRLSPVADKKVCRNRRCEI